MAVEIAAQCEWLNLLTSGTLVPASAFVAIGLFILREWLDWRRKSRARKAEIRALKQIFARECQLAWSICLQIKGICERFAPYEGPTMDACPFNFSTTTTTAGKVRYIITENGNPGSGGALSKPSVSTFSKHLYDISKLDDDFYEKAYSAYTSVIELKHFYDSLVDSEDTSRLLNINTAMIGFSGYALKGTAQIELNLKALYKYCAEKELTEGLLR